jgi:hypothetical protein
MKKTFTEKPPILKEVEKYQFKIFETGEMNINIIGARHPHQIPDIFNDYLHVIWKEGDTWIQYKFECTLDPGIYFLNSPMRKDGTAIVKHPQQIRSGLKIGTHKGKYKCMVQNKPFKVWRDANMNDTIDEFNDSISWGIQIHRANSKYKSKRIHNWSAGCTVLPDPQKYGIFMALIEQSIEKNPTWKFFTYTIIQGVFE